MNSGTFALVISAAALWAGTPAENAGGVSTRGDWLERWQAQNKRWRGVHVMVGNTNAASELIAELPELAALGINVLVIEINYSFAFESHPELRSARAHKRSGSHIGARLSRPRHPSHPAVQLPRSSVMEQTDGSIALQIS